MRIPRILEHGGEELEEQILVGSLKPVPRGLLEGASLAHATSHGVICGPVFARAPNASERDPQDAFIPRAQSAKARRRDIALVTRALPSGVLHTGRMTELRVLRKATVSVQLDASLGAPVLDFVKLKETHSLLLYNAAFTCERPTPKETGARSRAEREGGRM